MKVLFLPDYSLGNPYQRELARGLEKFDTHVIITNGVSRLPILGAISTYGKPDLIHLHWTSPYLFHKDYLRSIIVSIRFISEIKIAKILGIKIIWTAHNIINHEKKFLNLETICNKILIRVYDKIIVHGNYANNKIVKYYNINKKSKNKINIIPHGNYINSYNNELSREYSRKFLKIDDKYTVFIFFGLIRPYKDISYLIESFKNIKEKNAILLIVGKPKDRQTRKKLHEIGNFYNKIRIFPYFIPDDKIQLYMNAADVVVLPFQDILTSGSAMLAMSFGKALIVPRIGCVTEMLDNRGGFLYDPDEENGLLKALQLAVTADLPAMGKHNYDRAKHFDWEMIAHRTCEVYRDSLS
jgi:beta-1,4-mannosyltransferase